MGHPCKFQRVSHLVSVTARHSSIGRQPNFAALNRGRHLYSAGRPSRWAFAHILVLCQFLLISHHSILLIHGIQQDLPAQYITDPTRVECCLTQINVHKSPGPDGLPNWLLKDVAPLLSQPLAAIFTASLRQVTYHPSGNPRR